MKKHLAKRVNYNEMNNNTRLNNLLINAILKHDLDELENIFLEDFTYCNGKNKWETLQYFKDYFTKAEEQSIEIEIEEYTSLDYYPGCMAYKFIFRYLDSDDDMPSRLVLVPVFGNNKLIDLAISKKHAPMFVLERLMNNN